jgi:uncharacterized membrane protein required for colicin V production
MPKNKLAIGWEDFKLVGMFAAATSTPTDFGMMFDWFDLAFVVILFWGLFRGKHNGMTKELIPVLQWLTVLFVCGLVDPILGPIVVTQLKLSKMWGFIAAYAALFLAVMIPFSIIKHKFSKDLATSDYFKGNEYYLGMIAGVVKWICIVLVFMAVLNAPYYTPEEIAAHKVYMQQVYGGGQQGFGGDYFPTVQSLQAAVLQQSATGTWVENQPFLKKLLIQAQPAKVAAPPKPKAVIQFGNQTIQ